MIGLECAVLAGFLLRISLHKKSIYIFLSPLKKSNLCVGFLLFLLSIVRVYGGVWKGGRVVAFVGNYVPKVPTF